jgi:protein dithiol:quinone oxidoreductase
MNPFNWSYRAQCALGAAVCASMLAYALYVQHGMFMMPCPLFFLLGAAAGRRPGWLRRLSALLVAGCAALGAGIAIWHLRLQNLPPSEVPSCSGMDLGYMLDAFPLQKVIEKVFTGSGECAVVDWTFLGVSMPGWTLIWYVLLGVAVVWAGFRRKPASLA